MEGRLENLEMHVGYLQKTLDDLNVVVLEQARQLRDLTGQVALLQRSLAAVLAAVQESGEQEDSPLR